MKRILSLILSVCILLSNLVAFAETENTLGTITVTDTTSDGSLVVAIDGEVIDFTNKPFVDSNNRTQAPVREICELLGYNVGWNSETNEVIIERADSPDIYVFVIGEKTYRKNSEYFEMDTEAYTINDRTYIPLRYLAEMIGYKVEYNPIQDTEFQPSITTLADKLNAQMPTDKNYMFSPLSIKMILALAANGADGETKSEILNGLEISDLDNFNNLSKDMISSYSQSEGIQLEIANSIWLNTDKTALNFSSDFQKFANDFYSANSKKVSNDNAVSEVNSWVSDKTNDKITQIISAPDFDAMLINALYFKGAWKYEFSEDATRPDEFTNADGTKTQTDFMHQTDNFKYGIIDGTKIIELPYKNSIDYSALEKKLSVSMYVILSDKEIAPESVLNNAICNNKLEYEEVRLSMPKFKIEFDTSLNEILKNIGIYKAFDANSADFRKMFDYDTMYISDTIHKTFVEVNEKGTEAAAVTAIMLATCAIPSEPIELKIDRPFYFVIRDDTNNEILFMGRYAFAK